MATFLGNKKDTVTNGLFVYFDAKEYQDGDSTLNNLAGDVAILLENNTQFNGISFKIGDTSSAFALNYSGSGQDFVSSNFTYNLWALPTATHQIDSESSSGTAGTGGQKYVIGSTLAGPSGGDSSGAGISLGTNGVSVYEHAGSYMPPLLVYQENFSTTKMTNITVVYENNRPRVYVNGLFAREGVQSAKSNVFMRGDTIGAGSYGRFEGYLSLVQYYERVLSDKEIFDNYAFFAERFLDEHY